MPSLSAPRSTLLSRLFALGLGLGLGGFTASQASVYLIDFNDSNSGSPRPTGTWNVYATTASINGSTMVDSSGGSSPVTLSYSGQISSNTNVGTSLMYDPSLAGGVNPSWAVTAGANGAAGDYFYTNNTASNLPHSLTMNFGGLTAGQVVSLDILASRNSSNAKGFFEYSLNGTDWFGLSVLNPNGTIATTGGWSGQNTQSKFFSLVTDGYQNHRYMSMNEVTLTGSSFYVRTRDADDADQIFSGFNALRLTVVPEPSQGMLLLLGGIAGSFSLRYRPRRAAG